MTTKEMPSNEKKNKEVAVTDVNGRIKRIFPA